MAVRSTPAPGTMTPHAPTPSASAAAREPLLGLAPLARLAFAGGDLGPLRARLVARIAADPADANALLDLATLLQLGHRRELGLAVQAQALALQRVFRLAPAHGEPGVRVLVLMSPGDLTENNAVEFLVEGSDVTLELVYVEPGMPLPSALPEHDLVFVAVCEYDRSGPLLAHVGRLLQDWPRPVLNAPARIGALSRDRACALLAGLPGVAMPVTTRIDAATLARVGRGELELDAVLAGGAFPVIVRPIDSHKGQGLARLDDAAAIAGYLAARPEPAFYLARYVDYRGADGQFRKLRVLLIDGKPFVCHVAISTHWMINYMNAGMAESAVKRAEEAWCMATFDEGFAVRHGPALRAIAGRVGLEYVGFDCAETRDGQLLIFEFDAGMTVHAMDPVELYPYKAPQMRKVFAAFRDLLVRTMKDGRVAAAAAPTAGAVLPREAAAADA
jgi:glutathione synthase/RimK-type ligase-like ATP-grasp enzyme